MVTHIVRSWLRYLLFYMNSESGSYSSGNCQTQPGFVSGSCITAPFQARLHHGMFCFGSSDVGTRVTYASFLGVCHAMVGRNQSHELEGAETAKNPAARHFKTNPMVANDLVMLWLCHGRRVRKPWKLRGQWPHRRRTLRREVGAQD